VTGLRMLLLTHTTLPLGASRATLSCPADIRDAKQTPRIGWPVRATIPHRP
jgi:hypothetical protein